MNRARLPRVFAAFLAALLAPPLGAADPPQVLEATLAPADLSGLDNARGARLFVFASEARRTDAGWVMRFDAALPAAPGSRELPADLRLAFEARGKGAADARLFRLFPDGTEAEVPRLAARSDWLVPFGPVAVEGRLPIDVVVSYGFTERPEGESTWKKCLFLRPRQCLAGEIRIGETAHRIGLLDQNFNGAWADPCNNGIQDGDWLLFDEDGDGTFDLSATGSRSYTAAAPEARALGPVLRLAGRWWNVKASGRAIRLEERPTVVVEVEPLGWYGLGLTFSSPACGRIQADMGRSDRSVRIPAGMALENYGLNTGCWIVTGAFDPPLAVAPDGETFRLALGPPYRLRPVVQRAGDGFRFECRGFAGRAGETANRMPDCSTRRLGFELVVADSEGREVLRQPLSGGG
jgi:hypothetical protein